MKFFENKQDLRLTRILFYIILIISVLLFSNCSEDNIVEPDIFKGDISGQVKFLDGTPGAFARVNLQSLSNNRTVMDTADQDGMYKFDFLKSGDYILSFVSTGYDIHSL